MRFENKYNGSIFEVFIAWNLQDDNGWTTLIWVSLHGCCKDIVQVFLDHGADANAKDNEKKQL